MPRAGAEATARKEIDRRLEAAGWILQDRDDVNPLAGEGVAVREFPLKGDFADYMLYVDGAASGAIEAKPEGHTLTGVEAQSGKYSKLLPDALPAYRRPLPFLYESTGTETKFTNLIDPQPRSREVFWFHRPETMRRWLDEAGYPRAVRAIAGSKRPDESVATLRGRLQHMPAVDTAGLWPPQVRAIRNLEASLAADKPRALIQMTMGSGKTFTACNVGYRLAKFAKVNRILFLVDRANLGRQAQREFEQFVSPDDGRKLGELYVIQRLQSNAMDPAAKVVIATIQRVFSMLRGDAEMPDELDEMTAAEATKLLASSPVTYDPKIPIESFDVLFTDECHRSIYNLWRQVLEYFDSFIVGLTATPSKQTLGFFKQNLVMEYDHQQAVADGVNVDFDVYEIRTRITEQGSKVEAGLWVDKRDRLTRRKRWEQLDEELAYDSAVLDRDVVAPDQIRTIVRGFKEKLFTEMFPGRTEVPKTLIFAKDDSHAEDIVGIIREEFGKGNDFAQKITYKTTGGKAEELLAAFRNSYNPRIAVTVDMIATGTDVKPLEIVFFMRSPRSRVLFEQMKGRGSRVINSTDLIAVTPDAKAKTRFVIVDAVGIDHERLEDTQSLERRPGVSFEKLLEQVAFGNRDADVLSSLAGRLARLDRELRPADRLQLTEMAGGIAPAQLARDLLEAIDPDVQLAEAQRATGEKAPSPDAIRAAAILLADRAARILVTKPQLRKLLLEAKRAAEQTIDTVSHDEIIRAGYSAEATEAARSITSSFEAFIREHKDEIGALEVLFSRPYRRRPTFEQIRELAEAIQRPPRQWTPDLLWAAYERIDNAKVRGSGPRVLADLVSLVRYATRQQATLVPYADEVGARFDNWLLQQENRGRRFTDEQRRWLEMIRDQIANSLEVRPEDFDYVPFAQSGGLVGAGRAFGAQFAPLLEELNREVAA
ncbi:MAG: DEAD/DEAH box helicase family protein [Chloroflexota bacterium]|nr:DEAD/DEAH box helicase family protein [Chloroflexota bacterium]